jgi:hypothetical protein
MVATDGVGNGSSNTTVSWTVDATPPTITYTAPAANSYVTTGTVSVTFNASETSTFKCALDGATLASCCSQGTSCTQSISPGEGAHTYHVVATDLYNNVSGNTTRSWTTDTIPPTISATVDAANSSGPGGYVQFDFTFSEPLAYTTCTLDKQSMTIMTAADCSNFSNSSLSGNVSFSGLLCSDDSFNLSISGTDLAGNTSTIAVSPDYNSGSSICKPGR